MSNQLTPVDRDTEVVQIDAPTINLAAQLTKAEIDQQIATAHAFPRSLTRVNNNITTLVTMSERSAESCAYALPRGNKPIVGPSIRFAEVVAQNYGNCRIGARVVHVDRFEKFVEAEGVFHDLETNTATTMRVRRRIVDRGGRLFNDDMIIVTGNAAASIAKRNAILAGVPNALWQEAYEAAQSVVKGDLKTLPERIELLTKAFGSIGVTMDQVCEYLEIDGLRDMNIDRAATAAVVLRAIKSGEAQIEEYFAPTGEKAKPTGRLSDRAKPGSLNDIAGDAQKSGKGQRKPAADKAGQVETGKGQEASEKVEAATADTRDAGTAEGDGADAGEASDADTASSAEADTAGASEGSGDSAGDEGEHDDADRHERLQNARDRGSRARTRGQREDAIPPDLKNDEELKAAWLEGWTGEEA